MSRLAGLIVGMAAVLPAQTPVEKKIEGIRFARLKKFRVYGGTTTALAIDKDDVFAIRFPTR